MRFRFILVALITLGILYGILSLLQSAQNKVSGEPEKRFAQVSFPQTKAPVFKAEIADTALSRAIGLMNRSNMDQNEGMLFVFNYSRPLSFWMKDTLIPLDIIYISENMTVASITHDAEPCGLICLPLQPSAPAKYVVEINAGLAKKYGIKEGSKVGFKI